MLRHELQEYTPSTLADVIPHTPTKQSNAKNKCGNTIYALETKQGSLKTANFLDIIHRLVSLRNTTFRRLKSVSVYQTVSGNRD
jgi:hypothetical protein